MSEPRLAVDGKLIRKRTLSHSLQPGCQMAPAADPAELQALIRGLVSGNTSSFERLIGMARSSVADSRTIIAAEGVMLSVERDLTAGARHGIALLLAAVCTDDSAIFARVGESRDLMRALVLAVASSVRDVEQRVRAAVVLEMLMCTDAARACAGIVEALSDADLRGLVAATASVARDDIARLATIIVFDCLSHAPAPPSLLRRLVGSSVLVDDLATKLASDNEGVRTLASQCIEILVDVSCKHQLSLLSWIRPIVRSLRAIMAAHVTSNAAATPLIIHAGGILRELSEKFELKAVIAGGLPDFVAVLRGKGAASVHIALTVGNLGTHPGTLAAALRHGAVPSLAALLLDGDVGADTETVAASSAVAAFRALGSLSMHAESLAAMRAVPGISARLGNSMQLVSAMLRGDHPIAPLLAVFRIHHHRLVPTYALAGTGALDALVDLTISRDKRVEQLAIDGLLSALKWAVNAAPLTIACRAAFRVHVERRGSMVSMTDLVALRLCSWTDVPHQPKARAMRQGAIDGSAWSPPERGTNLEQFLVFDEVWVTFYCNAVLASREDAFANDLREVDAMTERARPFAAGRVLHYLAAHSGAAVAARLAEIAPAAVLQDVRVTAARGRWGRPLD